MLGVLVDLPFVRHRSVCLPVLARLWRPKRTGTRLELGVELVAALADRYPDRAIHLVADSAYAGKTLGQLPAHVTVTVRMRADAALYELPPPRTGRPGRPRTKGDRLPELIVLAGMTATRFKPATVRRYQRTDQVELAVLRCLWPGVFAKRPVQDVLVRAPDGYDLAIVSTDLAATPGRAGLPLCGQMGYRGHLRRSPPGRWRRQARNRTPRAVERTVPFGLICFSLVILWYAVAGHAPNDVAAHRALAP